jgi:hypothetical protein
MTERFGRILFAAILCLLVAGMTTSVLGQGKGRGGGVGGGRGSGGGHAGGPPPDVGVDRGLGNASTRSKGRSDEGLANASEKSKGRSDAGLERARTASNNLRNADRELRDHPGIANTLHTNANDLRADYQAALAVNPELKFGHFVSATRVAQNLGRRHPNITRTAILNGLASGRSLGQTLQDLGLSDHQASEARKQAEREIKRGKKS